MEWMNEQGIRVKVVRFIDAANKTTELDSADFHLTERFQPPSTGPSFDCQAARPQIEKAICGNPILAKLDIEMVDLYRQMFDSRKLPFAKDTSGSIAAVGATCNHVCKE
jgi:hypothetical protein